MAQSTQSVPATALGLAPTRLAIGAALGGLAALGASVLAGVLVGPVDLAPGKIVQELFGSLPFINGDSGLSAREQAILWQLRLPRVALGALVGSTLAMSGAAYQGVFRNPLADPYLLGAAAGAGLGATFSIAYGWGSSGSLLLPMFAFAGALLGVAGAYALGRSMGGRTSTTLILAGVAVASFLTAVQTFIQQRESETLREVYAWILGRLSTAGWSEVGLMLPYAILSAVVLVLSRRLLDVMSVGDDEATSLGVRVSRVRLGIVAAASLGTAAAVAVSGLIAFVGIIVPHAVRLIAGSSYRRVVPLSILYGGAFLVFADLLARTIIAPAELPIGVVTAFFGAPFFVLVLRTSGRSS